MTDTTDLAALLRREGLEPSSWSNGPHDVYGAHEHGYDKVLACASGSIRFGLPDFGTTLVLVVGDRLELPAGTRHDAVVGPAGVTCLEAHLRAGSLNGLRRLASGSWPDPTSRNMARPEVQVTDEAE
jgi:hypothetical protein